MKECGASWGSRRGFITVAGELRTVAVLAEALAVRIVRKSRQVANILGRPETM